MVRSRVKISWIKYSGTFRELILGQNSEEKNCFRFPWKFAVKLYKDALKYFVSKFIKQFYAPKSFVLFLYITSIIQLKLRTRIWKAKCTSLLCLWEYSWTRKPWSHKNHISSSSVSFRIICSDWRSWRIFSSIFGVQKSGGRLLLHIPISERKNRAWKELYDKKRNQSCTKRNRSEFTLEK